LQHFSIKNKSWDLSLGGRPEVVVFHFSHWDFVFFFYSQEKRKKGVVVVACKSGMFFWLDIILRVKLGPTW
jgi:hypothetical protein